jgi:magnesium transporter
MHKKFDIIDRTLAPTDKKECLIDLYINPDENDKQNILQNLDFDEHTLLSALDADEISRIEFEEDYTFIVWKIPDNYSFETQMLFKVSSVGLIIRTNKLIVIMNDDHNFYSRKEFSKLNSLFDYVIKVLLHIVKHYNDHIKAMKMISKELQEKITTSLENKYLVQMFNLSESLVYYINAINANSTVLIKLKNNASKLGLSSDDIDELEDLIIENKQCARQAEIYSTIRSSRARAPARP